MAKTSIQTSFGQFEISYTQLNEGVNFYSGDVVILHGWGAKKELMRPLCEIFSEAAYKSDASLNTRVFNIDLPGFGASSEPLAPMGYEAYAQVISEFFKAKQISQPIIIAHSFGCKIAATLAPEASGLILLGAAGLLMPKPLKVRIKIALSKLFKCSFFRAPDAKNLSPIMYESFKIAVNDDARLTYSKVTCKTLLLAGVQDSATLLSSAKELNALIKGSILEQFKGGHFFFLEPENQPLISAKIIEFLKLNKR